MLGNSREEGHPKGSGKRMEGRREKARRMEKKEEGNGREKWKEGKRKGREDTCNSCNHFYIINSVLETDLQNFISHNSFEMC